MKGQRLFVRETAAGDESALRNFYLDEGFDPPAETATQGIMARLVGDLVAHLSWNVEQNQATITHVYVARALRRKQVGRALVRDALSIAKAREVRRLVVSGACPAREFFLRMGFAERGQELVMEVF